jgi:nucleotide-binding universal stress UspA family protein
VEAELEALSTLAPLHNAPRSPRAPRRAAVPHVPHVAVFDTAFHATIPRKAAPEAPERHPGPARALRGKRLLEEGQDELARRHVRADVVEPIGEPAGALCDAARDLHADLVILCTHCTAPSARPSCARRRAT